MPENLKCQFSWTLSIQVGRMMQAKIILPSIVLPNSSHFAQCGLSRICRLGNLIWRRVSGPPGFAPASVQLRRAASAQAVILRAFGPGATRSGCWMVEGSACPPQPGGLKESSRWVGQGEGADHRYNDANNPHPGRVPEGCRFHCWLEHQWLWHPSGERWLFNAIPVVVPPPLPPNAHRPPSARPAGFALSETPQPLELLTSSPKKP